MPSTQNGTVTPEAAVRAYLTYLENPSSLVDEVKIAELEKQLQDTKDPIDRLLVMAALHKARNADESGLTSDFTAHAKKWADSEGIPEDAFRTIGVPDDVLQTAFGKAKRGRTAKAATTTVRRGRMSTDQLAGGILSFDGPFTIRDVSERIGGSPLTIKNVIASLEEQGKIRAAGEKAGSRGRAAKTWAVS